MAFWKNLKKVLQNYEMRNITTNPARKCLGIAPEKG
jgi:hypothetical protein